MTLGKGTPRVPDRMVLALMVVCLLGCAPADQGHHRPLVAASIRPLATLTREIAGPDADVLVLLPPGASPHSFEPTPRSVAEGSRASVVVRIGLGLDDWTARIVREAVSKGAPEILASAWVDSLLPAEAGHLHDEDEAAEPAAGGAEDHTSDPHIWLDPVAMIPVCQEIGRTLGRVDPAHARGYAERTATCVDSLRALDRQLSSILAPARGARFLATHSAWRYLSRRYGLIQADVVQEVPTREPGPKRMVAILQSAARSGVKAVFTEVQISAAAARTLAGELGVTVVMLDPQGTPDDPQRDRYFDLLRWNARRMVAALSALPGTSLPPPTGAIE